VSNDTRGGWQGRRCLAVWLVVTIAFGLLGTVWSFATPAVSAPDEPAHVVYAAAVVRGQIAEPLTEIPPNRTGLVGQTVWVELDTSWAALHSHPICFAFKPEVPAGCQPPMPGPEGEGPVVTPAGTYPPLYYLLVGWPSLVAEPLASMFAARVLTAWLSGALFGLAAVGLLGWRQLRAGAVGLALGVTPMAVYLTGTVNPNSVEIAAAVAAWTTGVELVTAPRSRGAGVRLAIAIGALAASRPFGPGFAIAIAAVLLFLGGRGLARRLRTDRGLRRAAFAAVAVVVLSVVWLAWRDTLGTFTGVPAGDLSRAELLRMSLGRLPARISQMIGLLGWADTFLPGWIVRGWLALTGVLVAAALVVGSWRQRIAIVVVLAAALAMPVLSDVSSANRIGFAFQGRYALPLAAGVPILSAWAVGERWQAVPRWGLAAPLGFVVAAQTGTLLVALGRYQNGALIHPLRSITGASSWEPPVPDLVLLGAFVGVAVALGVTALRLPTTTASATVVAIGADDTGAEV
jgi:hypothetical protein